MQNLGIENLSNSVNLDGAPVTRTQEQFVQREMEKNGLATTATEQGEGATSFSDLLRKSVDQVNQFQTEADSAVKELVAGRSKNIHETMLAIERADVSLKLMMQVRNKVLDAYREIMRMQV